MHLAKTLNVFQFICMIAVYTKPLSYCFQYHAFYTKDCNFPTLNLSEASTKNSEPIELVVLYCLIQEV